MKALLVIVATSLTACGAAVDDQPLVIRCTGETVSSGRSGEVDISRESVAWMIDPLQKTLTEIAPDGRLRASFCVPSLNGPIQCEVRITPTVVEGTRTQDESYRYGKMRTERQFRFDRRANTLFNAQHITSTNSPKNYIVRQMTCSQTMLPIPDSAAK